MFRTSVWISILSWAAVAALAAWGSWLWLARAYPELHPALLGLAAFLAVQAVYGLRAFARRRGWAMASYAPADEAKR